jgi:hypothetical protein
MAAAAVSRRFSRRLILRHGVGAVSSLRLPWCADDLKEDLLVPSSLIPKDKQDVENILGYANGSEIWRFPLTPAPVESCFKTLVLPKPSSFQKDSNDYFMQLMLKEKFGWYSIYSKKKKGDLYMLQSTATFLVDQIISENKKPGECEFLHGCIDARFASMLSTVSNDYKQDPKRIGKGKQGDAYIGHCISTGKKVLLKKLRQSLIIANGEPREVFFTKNIYDPSLRGMQCHWLDGKGSHWIAMDYEQKTLLEYMVDEKYDYHTRLSIFICVVQIVKSLKEKGIVYIDLEPENIFVNEDEGTEEMIIRLGDLGSCELLEDGKNCKPCHFQSWIAQYAAPELTSMKEYNEKAVTFSLGFRSSRLSAIRRVSPDS